MLEPRKNRFDYGEELNAPEGFELSAAIATTYTLDLDTLLAVSVALGFKDTLEGDLNGEKFVLLEAISELKDKLRVFYQKGKITVSTEYNTLYTLLEPCVSPVIPEGGEFSSFHPKVWLLRYVASGKKRKAEIRYKLIVLTRNLTFDKNWDIAVSIDGILKDKKNDNNDWITFLLDLLKHDKGFLPTKVLKKEMSYIEWKMSANMWNPKLLPGGGKFGQPLTFKHVDHILVVSPFLKDAGSRIKALNWLGKLVPFGGAKLLFSRAEELNAIGEKALREWECYSINPDVVEGEEKIEEGNDLQNLHAKLIVTERGNTTDWHIGSANVTSAALGDSRGVSPRNTEFMLRFSGPTEKIGTKTLLEQWDVLNEGKGLFISHKFEVLEEIKDESERQKLRRVIYEIVRSDWNMKAKIDDSNYTLTLSLNSNELLKTMKKDEIIIEVDQLAIQGGRKKLEATMFWENVELTQISAFIPLYIAFADGSIQEKVVIQVPLEIEGGDNRQQGILRKMLDNKEKILKYIRMLLDPDADKNEWLEVDKSNHNIANGDIDIFAVDKPIFEQLMYTAARHPESLKRLELLIRKLEKSDIEIPEDFRSLWEHFRVGVQIDD